MANGPTANQISNLAQQLREYAEEHDNDSESARDSAETSKRIALQMIPNAEPDLFQDQLINGLGRATTNKERCKAVDDLLQKMREKHFEVVNRITQLSGEEEETETIIQNFLHILSGGLTDGIDALKKFRDDLRDIKRNEEARDRYRTIAAILGAP